MIVPECVSRCVNGASNMACVSACMEMDDRPIQTGYGCGEPSAPYKVISATAPAPRDDRLHRSTRPVPHFVNGPRVRLCGGNPLQKRSAFGTRRPRGRLKCRRVSDEFGTHGFPCGRVCGASRAACCVFCSRSGSTGRYARAGLHGKLRRFGV